MSKNRVFTAINIFGLTIGLASSLAILLFIIDQSRMDDFQTKQDRIYRLEVEMERGGSLQRSAQLHSHLVPAIAENLPGIEKFARIQQSTRTLVSHKDGNKSLTEEDFIFADPEFFELFDFNLISGNPRELISAPGTAVITVSAALRHFGHTDVVGETVEFSSQYAKPRQITAVVADPAGNSSIQFDFISSNEELFPPASANPFNQRFSSSIPVYLLLSPGTSPEAVASQIVPELKKHTDKERLVESSYSLSSFDHVKYDMEVADRMITPVDKRIIRMFAIIAILIVSLALINYVNLTSARSIQRALEAGIRKVVGANRRTLMSQLLTESLVICLITLPLAILALELIIPYFETILQRKLFFSYKTNLTFLSGLVSFTLILALIAGLYPALVISRFKFSHIINGRPEHIGKGALLRKILVIFQFTFSIALIIGVFLVQGQLDFIRTQTLSYAPEHIVILKGNFGMMSKNYKTVKAEIQQLPGVQQVSVGSASPGDKFFVSSTNPTLPTAMTNYFIDENYLDVFNIKVLQGKNFGQISDTVRSPIIINQALADVLDIENPLNSTAYKFFGRNNNKIIGIVENFHFESMRDEIKPVFMAPASAMAPGLTQIIVKVESAEFDQTLQKLEATWDKFFPDIVFNYQFLDDKLDRMYTAEYRLSKIFGLFTILAVLITCLGLFGLSMHISEVRLKEVSIRKVLGASMGQIMRLLSAQVYVLVLIAALIASPLAWHFVSRWLQDFAYTKAITAKTFVFTFIACLALASFTIGWHAIKTARTNPAETLRNE